MGQTARHARLPHGVWRWWVVAAVLLLVGAGSLGTGLTDRHGTLELPAARPSLLEAGEQPRAAQAVIARSVPVSLRIPSIGLSVPLSELGLNADGTVQLPVNVQQAGWFRLGPTPGQAGSAVILGHVDSFRGPAVFFRLRLLRPGDLVTVTRADQSVATFAVVAIATYPKEKFPASRVYGSHGGSTLQLVTCGGTFDTGSRSYRSNVVVYTALVAP